MDSPHTARNNMESTHKFEVRENLSQEQENEVENKISPTLPSNKLNGSPEKFNCLKEKKIEVSDSGTSAESSSDEETQNVAKSKLIPFSPKKLEKSDEIQKNNGEEFKATEKKEYIIKISKSDIPTTLPSNYPIPIPIPLNEISAMAINGLDKTSDFDDLDGSNGFKVERSPPSPFRDFELPVPSPCLKGTLSEEIESKDHIVTGWWGMSKKAHLPGGDVSSFELRRKSEPGDEMPKSGSYKSHFIVRIPGKPPEKVHEDELALTFTLNKSNEWNIEGAGKNKYGGFRVLGSMDSQFKIELFKIYPARELNAAHTPRNSFRNSSVGRKRGGKIKGHLPTPLTLIPSADISKDSKLTPLSRELKGLKRSNSAKSYGMAPLTISSAGEDGHSDESSAHLSRRVSRVPNYLQEDNKSTIKLSEPLKKCANLLRQVIGTKKHSHWFRDPVDAVALNLPTYSTIVKKPMDLGTLKNKLETGQYNSPYEFADDMRLVFANALAFTPDPREPVNISARELSHLFEQKFSSLDFFAETPKMQSLKRKKSTPTASSYSLDYGSTKRTKSSGNLIQGRRKKDNFMSNFHLSSNMEGTASIPVTQLFDMQRQMMEMQAKIKELQQHQRIESLGVPIPISSSKIDGSRDCSTDLTFEEKKQLSMSINKLPVEKLTRVFQIIQERTPLVAQQEDTEIEIDIDVMDTGTLRELQVYIDTLKKANKNAAVRRSRTYASESESDDEWH
mmetsp:Transcript_956/g.1434  ORF Transcript_956/g.1434 Transcript_956/m.1434 type:complete len:732 (-) Transcript_956:281-2476(-)|eukprot:CAMPEP_0171462882 /NCGR_PEP_ID=MMETSP0945-20130129/6756_1 /TAXON_ID=109269 /ORGANISM="Vaucheria litorea, Strain CCMP2940" /LENGTH=731 /DNA_ID=CAMNT_0011989525 /DNA_START=213 /DNA_END=2408 /DNA_ORIENTATION=+